MWFVHLFFFDSKDIHTFFWSQNMYFVCHTANVFLITKCTVSVSLIFVTLGRKEHPAHSHCMRLRRDADNLASTVGPGNTVRFSCDDKCKVNVGILATPKQQKIIMRSERRVKLPDHSIPVAPGHKITPSVYVFPTIVPNKINDSKAVKWTGTFSLSKCISVSVRRIVTNIHKNYRTSFCCKQTHGVFKHITCNTYL